MDTVLLYALPKQPLLADAAAPERVLMDTRFDAVVLLRCAARNGATKAEIARDLAAVFAGSLPAAALQRAITTAADRALAAKLIRERRQRLILTDTAPSALTKHFGAAVAAKISAQKLAWTDLRAGPLTLLALGLADATAAQMRACESAEGLAGLIVQQHLGLTPGRVASMATLRAQLAILSLERAFGHRLTADLGRGSHLSAKAGRALAAELLAQPRQFSSDAKLIVATAAQHLGATGETAEALRSAAIKAWTAGAQPQAKAAAALSVAAANDAPPLAGPAPVISLPDMAEFSRSVLQAARPVAEGWPGNRKAFISRVWHAIRALRPEWSFSETAFKAMLIEAHRLGRLVLANADLKNKGNIADVEASAVTYKNSVWHYVRIED
ncbi:MAG: hypothetical protein NW216_12350 [Hyphomicrobium sp.]|nr:hypothetical protein [Hyphomicrobium sp.]